MTPASNTPSSRAAGNDAHGRELPSTARDSVTPYWFEDHTPDPNTPRNERLWHWIGSTIPSGTGWMLYGRWHWQRRFGAWWLSWWGWAFFYSRPWRPGSFDG